VLEREYYPTVERIVARAQVMFGERMPSPL
jgi:hypothetical protein